MARTKEAVGSNQYIKRYQREYGRRLGRSNPDALQMVVLAAQPATTIPLTPDEAAWESQRAQERAAVASHREANQAVSTADVMAFLRS